MIELRTPTVDELGGVVRALRSWQHTEAPMQLHPGDLGWAWKLGAAALAASLRTWNTGGRVVAVGLVDSPTVLRLTAAPDDLGDEATQVQPLFISIDPERDRRLGIAEFTAAFHPTILGLAGDANQTRAAADSFRIHYAREDDAAAPDGYSMSHSPALYLIGPEGDWLRQFTYGTPAADILADLQNRL